MECGIVDSMLSMWISHVVMVVLSAVISAGLVWWFVSHGRSRGQMLYPGERRSVWPRR